MDCTRKRVVIFGSWRKLPEDGRNNILIMAFESLGWHLLYCMVNSGTVHKSSKPISKLLIALIFAPFRWICLTAKYFFLPPHQIIYVPYPPYIDAWLACLLARLNRKWIIIDAFMGLYDTIVRDRRLIGKKSIFARLIWWYEKIILQSIDLALVDTIEHELMLQQDFKPLKSKIDHIPVGVDEKLWQPSPYPADTELFNVLFWATFIPLHGVEVVAQAAKMLEKDSPQIYFTIIGNGQLGEEFRDLLKKLKPKNINWIDRFLPLSEIEKLVKKSHCCLGVFGTQNKAQRVIPYKVSQALAAGRPIITARTSAVEQILTDKIDSVLVRCGDPEDLSGAIKQISDDREFALKIGKNGRKLYESKLSNRIIKNRLEHILESLELT